MTCLNLCVKQATRNDRDEKINSIHLHADQFNDFID